MKNIRLIWVLLVLFSPLAADAQEIQASLVSNTWQLVRHTGLGVVTTVWRFSADGGGSATQTITRGETSRSESYNFTYTLNNNRILIQEEVDSQWIGYIGMSRWTFKDNTLIDDIRFRGEAIIFNPL